MTSRWLTHPHIAIGQAYLTSKFYLNKLPKITMSLLIYKYHIDFLSHVSVYDCV
jgi:hypothetical protein